MGTGICKARAKTPPTTRPSSYRVITGLLVNIYQQVSEDKANEIWHGAQHFADLRHGESGYIRLPALVAEVAPAPKKDNAV